MRRAAFAALVVLAVAVGCETTTEPATDGADAAVREDGGTADGATDAWAPSQADGGAEAGPPDDILGTLEGACPLVSAYLTSPDPILLRDKLVFAAGETYDPAFLSEGGDAMYATANAGGSSGESEVMSFEVLHYCDGAVLRATETQIHYQPPDDAGPNSITDLLVEIGGHKIGVSVTRAYKPSSQTLSDADLKALLEKKLEGVNRSSVRVKAEDKWDKQILHVFAVSKAAADAVERVYPQIEATLRADTIVLVTETRGGGFVYCDPDPPLGTECP